MASKKDPVRDFGHAVVLIIAANAHDAIDADPWATEAQKASRHLNAFIGQLIGHGIVQWLTND